MRLIVIEELDLPKFIARVNETLASYRRAYVVNVQRNVYYVGNERYEDPLKNTVAPPEKRLRTSYMASIVVSRDPIAPVESASSPA